VGSSKSQRSEIDQAAVMGCGATRTMERVAAAMGMLNDAPIEFEVLGDVPYGGVLLAVPALLSNGLLAHTGNFYALPRGFYGIKSIFLLLAFMALARLGSLENLRYTAPGEWGKILGLDRIPEVRTLRRKLTALCGKQGQAAAWGTQLATAWLGSEQQSEGMFYVDGHMRVYHGQQTQLPRHYVARQRLCLRGTMDYWVNAMDGQPFFLITKEVDPGLLAVLRQQIVPWLEQNLPAKKSPADSAQPRLTLVFDREAYSPDFFLEMQTKGIAILTYNKFPGADWPVEDFVEKEVQLVNGQTVKMKLAEKRVFLAKKVWVREIRKLTDRGHQTAIISTHERAEQTLLAARLFARWCQENFLRYMRQHYGLDRLIEYDTEPIPDTTPVVNPAWRSLDSQVRSANAQLHRQLAEFAQMQINEMLEPAKMEIYQCKKAQLLQDIQLLQKQIQQAKDQRKQTPHHIQIAQLPPDTRFTRLATEKKHFIDTLKLIAYRAETTMAQCLSESLARTDDTRSLLRQVYGLEADLLPDRQTKTLRVAIHHCATAAQDTALCALCEELNQTQTIFPGTDLRLIYQVGSG
jgi:hypothetical protein